MDHIERMKPAPGFPHRSPEKIHQRGRTSGPRLELLEGRVMLSGSPSSHVMGPTTDFVPAGILTIGASYGVISSDDVFMVEAPPINLPASGSGAAGGAGSSASSAGSGRGWNHIKPRDKLSSQRGDNCKPRYNDECGLSVKLR